jgi:hypothetical protein
MKIFWTISASQVFGSNLIQIDSSPVRFAKYRGDGNQNGVVDLTVVVITYNNSSSFVSVVKP